MTARPARPLSGRHVLALFVGGFGVIIAVNLTLAFQAVHSFPGLETANSYVASHSFDDRRAAQEALGWDARVSYDAGQLRLAVTTAEGRIISPDRFGARLGRPTTRTEDREIAFAPDGTVPVTLAPGQWRIDLHSLPGEPPFVRSLWLRVAP
jgi:nitrogen fixation protein FixH